MAATAAEELAAERGGVRTRSHRHHQNHAVHRGVPPRGAEYGNFPSRPIAWATLARSPDCQPSAAVSVPNWWCVTVGSRIRQSPVSLA
jgi:hypothetical protein